MKLESILQLITGLAILFSALQAAAWKYCALDEYIRIHPEEKLRGKSFKKNISKTTVTRDTPLPPPKIAFIYSGDHIYDHRRRSITSFKSRLLHYEIEPEIIKFPRAPSATTAEHAANLRKAIQTERALDVTIMCINDDNGTAMAGTITLDMLGKKTANPACLFRQV